MHGASKTVCVCVCVCVYNQESSRKQGARPVRSSVKPRMHGSKQRQRRQRVVGLEEKLSGSASEISSSPGED